MFRLKSIGYSFLELSKKAIPGEYQIKKILISSITRIFFFLSAFGFYFLLLSNIPNQINYRYEIAMIGSVTFTILILFPIFERVTNNLKSKLLSEYLLEDPVLSRKAYKRFNIESLIKAVFPDMVKISGSSSGSLFILNEKQSFDVYYYKRGKQKKILPRKEPFNLNHLIRFLMKSKKGVSIHETFQDSEINKVFVDLKSDYILPFIFREKLFGFLSLSSIPDTESLSYLNILASQCALVIHNHILSSQIVDSIKYKQEEEAAARIQKSLQFSGFPEIPNIKMEWLKQDSNLLLEFFKTSDGFWNFILLHSGGYTRSSGLVHSFFLGYLYARISRNQSETFIEMKDLIHQSFHKVNWKESPNFLIIKIIPDLKLQVYQEGKGFLLFSEMIPNKELVTLNWISDIELGLLPIYIYYRGNPVLKIRTL